MRPVDWADLFCCLLPCEPVVFHLQVEFTGSFIEAKCKPVKKYKWVREKRTSEPVKSPYGVGRYCEMAVFLTRSHLLWLIRLLYVHSGSFFIHFVKCVMSFDKRYLHSQFILVSSFQDGFRPDKRKNFLWFVGYFFNWQLINCNVWHFYYYFARK